MHMELGDDGGRRIDIGAQIYLNLKELAGLSAWDGLSAGRSVKGIPRPVGPDEVPGGAVVISCYLDLYQGPSRLLEILPVDGGPDNVILAVNTVSVGYEPSPGARLDILV